MKRGPIILGAGLISLTLVLAGFRTHDFKSKALKPQLAVLKGLPGGGCGTGSSLTWSSLSIGHELKMDRERATKLIEPELRLQGFERYRIKPDGITFKKHLNTPGGVAVMVRDSLEKGHCSLYMSVQYPKVTWYGLRVPSFGLGPF